MDGKKVIIAKLRDFKKSVSKDFPITRMYLFGSMATGKMHKYSDIDLVIVSPKFREMNFFKRGAKMYDYWKIRKPVDFLCYTPEEFERLNKQITIVREATTNGTEI
ncbi:hypothetical protein A3K63_01800 [Candidatus Micrarchaeota archaeon RBG_16_49_10]|nr:MAG: hypothetical protein A3K63_01800 [Candidatus Micrarchaeota archaeon RBG_16_49_10]